MLPSRPSPSVSQVRLQWFLNRFPQSLKELDIFWWTLRRRVIRVLCLPLFIPTWLMRFLPATGYLMPLMERAPNCVRDGLHRWYLREVSKRLNKAQTRWQMYGAGRRLQGHEREVKEALYAQWEWLRQFCREVHAMRNCS